MSKKNIRRGRKRELLCTEVRKKGKKKQIYKLEQYHDKFIVNRSETKVTTIFLM